MHISFHLASTDTKLLCQYTTPSNNNMHHKSSNKTKRVGEKNDNTKQKLLIAMKLILTLNFHCMCWHNRIAHNWVRHLQANKHVFQHLLQPLPWLNVRTCGRGELNTGPC